MSKNCFSFSIKKCLQVISIDARNHGSSEHSDEMNYFVQTLDAKKLA